MIRRNRTRIRIGIISSMDLIFAGIIGFLAALLVNYLADTLPKGERPGRPLCQHCQSELTWRQYLTFSPCPHCKKGRTVRTFATILLGIGLSLWLWNAPPPKLGYWLGILLLTYFAVVVIIDFEHRYIMISTVLVGAILGLVIGTLLHGVINTFLGGLTGLGIMGAFYLLGILFARYRARKRGIDDGEEALGLGDVYLSTVLGLLLGWPRILYGLFFGVLAGGLISFLLILALIATKRYQTMTVFTAYGPYLIFGAFLILYTPQILTLLSGR
ncbi:MAG: hypothetical protein DDG60_12905 [Anaerolineae bacterium]|nr:MAG: hypothetical protein DDG60_12905 [Anaerolineae bacterium]